MPVPSTINDLSTTAGANYPAGTESPSTIDDYLRAHAAFIATLRDGKVGDTGDETIAGIKTFSSTIVGNISGNAGTATSATTATNLAGGSAGTLPYQTGSGATAQLAAGTSGFVLRCNGAAAPSWTAQSAIDAGSVDGKSFGTFGAAGGILYATSTSDASATVAGTSGQVLLSGGAGAPTWAAQSSLSVGSATTATSATSATSATTATNIAGGAAGAVPYQSGAGSTALLAAGTSGQVLQSGGAGAPSWVNQSSLAVGSATTAGNVTGTVAIANGGTGQTTAAAAFSALKQDATTSATGVVELATTAEAQAGTDTTRAVTPSGLDAHMSANALGWGQTWQDMTVSRAFSTSYTNSTGRPIVINVRYTGSGGGVRLDATIGGVVVPIGITANVNGAYTVGQAIVPDGVSYSVAPDSSATMNSWHELR